MSKHIVFVGGGTLGHITPILAVMQAVQAQAPETKCTFIGQPQDMDSPILQESPLTFDVRAVQSGKLHRHLTLNQFRQISRFFKGLREASALIKELKPDVIFAKGGYITVPVVLAAARRKIPIYCHESDAVPGLANRFVARYAQVIFTSYPAHVYKALPKSRIVQTGQPVRDMFYVKHTKLPAIGERALDPAVPVITIIGGSQGAKRVNELIRAIWKPLLNDYQLVHVTGPANHKEYEAAAGTLPPFEQGRLHVVPLLSNELPALFQKSVVVVSRSGGTVSELAASRACAVLLPLSTAAQNHQWANARALVHEGAAVAVDETTTNPQELERVIREVTESTVEQTSMRASIGRFDYPDAAARMADYLLK